MATKKLKDMLNMAIAREISVSIQYMWQHVMVKGMYAEAIGPVFRTIALTEMLHAEQIAERLDYLGGEPTTKPATTPPSRPSHQQPQSTTTPTPASQPGQPVRGGGGGDGGLVWYKVVMPFGKVSGSTNRASFV